ncbi:aromatic amino acid transaminase [Pseudomonas sp. NPDC089569]|uniref:amino acid aminotransferase n=1 Tax=Pseudomonas sp. NPDC089569 TaxID=3390722 RepID=UPI003CFF7553
MFSNVKPYAGDPIYTLFENFQKDVRQNKVSLSVGVYCDEDGNIPYMEAVRVAESRISQNFGSRSYLPMEGMGVYRSMVQGFLFGDGSEANQSERISTIQTVGATGALRIGADFLSHSLNCRDVWVSDYTWETHCDIFAAAGYRVHRYPFYDFATGGVKFDAMYGLLSSLSKDSVVVLHASAHNPTGAELSEGQWRELSKLAKEKGLIFFLDMAYQGFSKSVEEDAIAIRTLIDFEVGFLLANSFSKNFSMYGERVGSLSVVCPNSLQAEKVTGQLKATVRQSYSSPPTHGARVISSILGDGVLKELWLTELDSMKNRIQSMRYSLYERLLPYADPDQIKYLLRQSGMFSFTGLSTQQIDWLKNERGIYLVGSGRICIAGLTTKNIDYVAESLGHILSHNSKKN